MGISKLNTCKHFVDINEDDDVQDRTLAPFRGYKVLSVIRSYGHLLQAEISVTDPKLLAVIRRKKDSIDHIQKFEER